MDAERFDGVARRLGSGSSRRELLKGLAGGTVAGAIALVSGREAAVARRRGRRCRGNHTGSCPSGKWCCGSAGPVGITFRCIPNDFACAS